MKQKIVPKDPRKANAKADKAEDTTTERKTQHHNWGRKLARKVNHWNW